MRLKSIILSIVSFLLISGCSVYRLSDTHTKGKLKRSGLKHSVLETKDYTFSYWDTGESDKPIYVLLHGFGSPTHFQWFKQAKMLTKTHRLILPNLLFFGSESRGPEKYGVQDQVTAMAMLINELEIDSMILGGISYGGLVAAELAMQEHDKIMKLTIFSSPVKFYTDGDLETVVNRAGVTDIQELLVPSDIATMQKLVNVVLFKNRKVPGFILRDLYKNLFLDKKKSDQHKALLEDIQKGKSFFINRDYQFDYPVLLIWGAEDELIPVRVGKELKAYLPSSRLHIIPKAGHAPNIEKKKKFNSMLLDFITK